MLHTKSQLIKRVKSENRAIGEIIDYRSKNSLPLAAYVEMYEHNKLLLGLILAHDFVGTRIGGSGTTHHLACAHCDTAVDEADNWCRHCGGQLKERIPDANGQD